MVTYDEGDHDVEGESSRGIRHQTGSYNRTTLDAYRVLVVAGDEKLIALTRLSLAKNGLEVEAATTAYDGLATLEDSPHDLVILDTELPDLSGWEVLRRIRGSSEVPVMLLTRRPRTWTRRVASTSGPMITSRNPLVFSSLRRGCVRCCAGRGTRTRIRRTRQRVTRGRPMAQPWR
jgi:CheY-like chemotaxis protein